jgi:hypothetical protein
MLPEKGNWKMIVEMGPDLIIIIADGQDKTTHFDDIDSDNDSDEED